MKYSILALMAFACSFSVMASVTASQSMDQFCADRSDVGFSKQLTKSSDNLLSFQNQGGLINGGVCWWHSRFQRNALYLTIYKPANQKPTRDEAKKIIAKIRAGNEIVSIPGFRNFREFSLAFDAEILRELEKWQKGDGILRFRWVGGLSGATVVGAEKMRVMMDELYDYVEEKGNIAYTKLQIKGIDSHAWLIVNMKQTTSGYDLEILDSNFPLQTSIYKYRQGDESFSDYNYGNFTPYLEKKDEMDKISMTILKQCNPDEYDKRKKAAKETKESKEETAENN